MSSSTPEMIERVRLIIREDRRHSIDEVRMCVLHVLHNATQSHSAEHATHTRMVTQKNGNF